MNVSIQLCDLQNCGIDINLGRFHIILLLPLIPIPRGKFQLYRNGECQNLGSLTPITLDLTQISVVFLLIFVPYIHSQP